MQQPNTSIKTLLALSLIAGVTLATSLFQPMTSGLMQGAYIYQTRNPNETWGDFYLTIGAQLAARGQMLVSEDLLEKAARLKPNDFQAQLTYGIVLESLDKLNEAVEAYQRAINADHTNVNGYYRLGMLYDRKGQINEGLSFLEQALTIEPGNALLNYDVGVLYSKLQRFDQSAKYSKIALELEPEFAEAYNNYAYALSNLGDFKQSLEFANKSLELKTDSAATLDTRGFAYFGLKEYAKALDDYNTAIQLDPAIGEIYLHKAQVLEIMGQTAEAVENYKKYLTLTPEAPDKKQVQQVISSLQARANVPSI